MAASESFVTWLQDLVRSRADSEGSRGARTAVGTPGSYVDYEGRVGKIATGVAWDTIEENGEAKRSLMDVLTRGVADGLVDLFAQYEAVGTIKMFSGSPASIPTGWHVCDGTGGTPDLRDKFIKGGAASGTEGGGDTTTGISEANTGFPTDVVLVNADPPVTTSVATSAHVHAHDHSHTQAEPVWYQLIFIMKVF